MLKKFVSIQNVGLFADARWSRHPLGRTALLYADNGRGKSTLCTILRSVASGDPDPVQRRTTIDANGSQVIELELDQSNHVTFEDGAWSETRPEILVFDTAFVRSTVHSGGLVTADHRRNLLQFALGAAAVAAQGRLDSANTDESTAKAARDTATTALKQHAGTMSVPDLVALDHDADIDAKIAKAEERLTHARRKAEILRRPVGEAIPEPTLDLDRLFGVLDRDLAMLHDHAASAVMVDAHLRRLDDEGAEAWVRRGLALQHDETCPFCAQPTVDLPLLQAYREYFDDAYAALADELSTVAGELEAALSAAAVAAVVTHVETQRATFTSWNEHVHLPELELDEAALAQHVDEAREQVRALVAAKRSALGSSIDEPERRAAATRARTSILQMVRSVNAHIDANVAEIRRYQEELGDVTTESCQLLLDRLRLTRARHREPVREIVRQLETATTALAEAGDQKKEARQELAAAMSSTLAAYRDATNVLLAQLGARFRIPDMPTTWVGGRLGQTEYVLELRGRRIKPNDKDEGLSFDIALSDGDKRTLALAFFLASIQADPAAASKVVVFDDPVCSLDRGRRETTIMAIDELSASVGQLIVMSHDAHLLRDLRTSLTKRDRDHPPTVAALGISGDDYTTFVATDLDRVCESTYMQNFRTVDRFCSHPSESERLAAGQAIRPLLEGYLHRRFPGMITSDVMLGKAITQIEDAEHSSRLSHATGLVAELRRIATFANLFHHDTKPDFSAATMPPAATIRQFASDALDIVTGAPSTSSP
ncbi:AAA family ATPase [Aeromicrobium sp. Leaf350]|uniref:AAA family ATPase n=1 Tax=Aeromicrobium sp. Leaf350 TaxID=2876565 RepID=UPI001E5B281F|nr:AAA family ATPase [Aeromicrobium sp. Leaf350]